MIGSIYLNEGEVYQTLESWSGPDQELGTIQHVAIIQLHYRPRESGPCGILYMTVQTPQMT